MIRTLRDSYSVWWVDLRILRHLWPRFLITSLVSPVLYLLAFGYGLGRNIQVDGIDYLEFVIPGIIALTAMSTSFNAAGTKLSVDRLYYKSFDEILMSPVSLLSVVLGKGAIGVVRGLGISLCFILIGLVIASMRITPSFVLSLLTTCAVFSFMGVLCALLCKTHQDMATYSSVLILPMTFLGGTFFSLNQVPEWLRVVLNILPLTHASHCLRAAALGDPFPWLSLAGLAAFGGVFFIASLIVLRRSSV